MQSVLAGDDGGISVESSGGIRKSAQRRKRVYTPVDIACLQDCTGSMLAPQSLPVSYSVHFCRQGKSASAGGATQSHWCIGMDMVRSALEKEENALE
jgi:hypothetical protein